MAGLFRVFMCFGVIILSAAVSAKPQFEPLNSTLIAKLHLDSNPGRSQMVGAYQIAFRPVDGGYINSLAVLLNPGLRIEKVVGVGNRTLDVTSSIVPIPDMNGLELRVAEITLPSTLLGTNRSEIVVHYRGTLEDLSRYAPDGAPDQLNPDFAMIRARGFAYPVFAIASKTDIEEAWQNTRLSQVAFIEFAGSNTIAGSLAVQERTLAGDKTNYELKANKPSTLMSVSIAPYETLEEGPISVTHLRESSEGAQALLQQLVGQFKAYQVLLGAPTSGSDLRIVEVPAGTQTLPSNTNVFVNGPIQAGPELSMAMQTKVADLWRINARGRANHWADGLDTTVSAALNGTLSNVSSDLFGTAKDRLEANASIGKTPLEDFLREGLEADQAAISALAFAVLHDLLGGDVFFEVVQAVRAEAASGYADMASVAEVLDGSIKNKKARKFAKNWFGGKRIGRTLGKASSFDDLVARQR